MELIQFVLTCLIYFICFAFCCVLVADILRDLVRYLDKLSIKYSRAGQPINYFPVLGMADL